MLYILLFIDVPNPEPLDEREDSDDDYDDDCVASKEEYNDEDGMLFLRARSVPFLCACLSVRPFVFLSLLLCWCFW